MKSNIDSSQQNACCGIVSNTCNRSLSFSGFNTVSERNEIGADLGMWMKFSVSLIIYPNAFSGRECSFLDQQQSFPDKSIVF